MKRDMDLCRKILLKIEEFNTGTVIYNLSIEGYTKEQIAYHCKILHEASFIDAYKAQYGDNELVFFGVGSLTWEGNEYLNQIRDNTIWAKVNDVIKKKGLPSTLDVIKNVASSLITAVLNSH